MNRTTLLYISGNLSSSVSGGRTLSEANLGIFKACPNVDIDVLSLGRVDTNYTNIKSTSNTCETALANLRLFSGCLNKPAFDAIINVIAKKQPNFLYLDTSLFGRLALTVKKSFPRIKIITFFHNIELDFKFECYPGVKRFLYTPAIFSDYMNERWAIHYSDIVIALHGNDSMRMQQLYGRKADFVHPICIAMNLNKSTVNVRNQHALPEDYILFVGSAFSPNIKALKFLCEKIMPHLNEHLVVVGSNLEHYRQKYSTHNVSIVGSVDDLAPFYDNAKLAVTPVFTGAGMKVKVAEALMHGKCVIGSKFAFIGYEKAVDCGVCIVADTVNDYVELIKNYKYSSAAKLQAKEIFLQEFSHSAGITRMKRVLKFLTD